MGTDVRFARKCVIQSWDQLWKKQADKTDFLFLDRTSQALVVKGHILHLLAWGVFVLVTFPSTASDLQSNFTV